MRRTSISLLALVAMATALGTPAFAGSGEGTERPAASKSKAAGTAAPKAAAKKAAKPAMPDVAAVASELSRMQQMLEEQAQELAAQRRQIEALQQQIHASRTEASSAPASIPGPAKVSAASPAEPSLPPATESANNVARSTVATGPDGGATPGAVSATGAVIRKPESRPASLEQAPQLPSAIELAGGRIQLGFTVYGDWEWYASTSYGPQFLTQINQPGPGNDNYNAFNVNRAYINLFYTPTSGKYTLRLTPNIYRDFSNVPALPFGKNAQIGGTANGSLNLRMKYAYVQFNHPFSSSSAFGKDTITLGQTTNPLIDWQEAFYGYRFTSLVPWNYLSLSSTHMGAKIGGPVMSHGKMYLDYEAGVFDSGSFHNQEQAAEKQVMARLSFYPFGGQPRFQGFGVSAFVDFGYSDTAPDLQNTSKNSLYRTAFFAHYWAPHFALLGEYDFGKNAFGAGNLFSGSAPIPTDPTYGYLATEASGILTASAQEQGFDFYGHVDIPHSPFSLFGLYQYFQPNIALSEDPLDFQRVVGGIGYTYDAHLMFAIDSQNLLFTHSQGTYNGVANAVPPEINALFLNAQVNY